MIAIFTSGLEMNHLSHSSFLVGFVSLDLLLSMWYLFFFLLAIALSILRFTASDYPFGTFQLFLIKQ